MPELVGLLVATAICAAVLPFSWDVCDRRAASGRLAGPAADHIPAGDYVDGPAFLAQVARNVRAGAGAAQAIMSARPCSPEVERAQQELRNGAPLGAALAVAAPETRTLVVCLHHGVLSVQALDHAMALDRQQQAHHADVRAALALARRSAVILTSVPFGLLATAALLSGSVRSALAAPVVAGAVLAGTVLNRAGFAWMSSVSRAVMRGHAQDDEALMIASGVSAHLRAGGTVVSAFGALSSHSAGCGAVASALASGAPFRTALEPLRRVCPDVVDTLVSCTVDGLPVAPALDTLIADTMAARTAAVRESVAELPARGTAPLVLLVLPSFLLVAVAPLALAALRGMSLPRI